MADIDPDWKALPADELNARLAGDRHRADAEASEDARLSLSAMVQTELAELADTLLARRDHSIIDGGLKAQGRRAGLEEAAGLVRAAAGRIADHG